MSLRKFIFFGFIIMLKKKNHLDSYFINEYYHTSSVAMFVPVFTAAMKSDIT